MKSPDEIKMELAAPIPVHYHTGDCEPRLTPLTMVDLEALHANSLALIQQLEAKVPRWISVEERLPKRYEHVLVATRFTVEGEPDFEIAYLALGGWKKEEGHLYGRVTHWMPLPAPPEE